MSSIRLSGTSSGYYDLTVPAAAGTNSIDLSNLPVKDSNGNLGIGTSSPTNFGGTTLQVNHASSYSSVLASSGAYTMQFMASQTNGAMNMGARSNHHVSITTNDLPRMTIDTSGRVGMPQQPSFFAKNSSGSHNNGAVILFNSVVHNNGSNYDATTGRFTAPIAGYYFFYSVVCWNRTTATGDHYCDLRHNGNVVVRMYTDKSGSANVHPQTSGQYGSYLSANDYIDVLASAGGPIINDGNHCNFGGYKYA